MAFSKQLMDALRTEAANQGLRSPSAISVALREQLVAEKSGGMDGRVKDYWIAARVVDRGVAMPLPGALRITGLDAMSDMAVAAAAYHGFTETMDPSPAKHAISSARVALSRSGAAHVVVPLPHSKRPPDVPDAWVDLYLFRTEADATAKAATLTPGKVF